MLDMFAYQYGLALLCNLNDVMWPDVSTNLA